MQLSKSKVAMVITMAVCLLAHASASLETRSHKFGPDGSFKGHLRQLQENLDTNGNEAKHPVQSFATEALIEQGTKDLMRSLASLEDGIVRRSLIAPAYPPGGMGTYGGSGPISSPPGSQTPLSFQMVLDMDFDSIANTLANFSLDTQTAIATGLSISPSNVAITSITRGSVIVDFNITTLDTMSAEETASMVSQVTSTPADVLGSTYLVTTYQANGVTVSQVGSTDGTGGPGQIQSPGNTPGGSSLLSVSVRTCLCTVVAAVLLSF